MLLLDGTPVPGAMDCWPYWPYRRNRCHHLCFVDTLATCSVLLVLLSLKVTAFNLDTKVRVRHSASVAVPVPSNAICDHVELTQYMRLPVEQYALVPMPLNSTLSRIPGTEGEFELVVPPVRFLWLNVQPVVNAVVNLERDRVVIAGDRCTLHGSPFIKKVRLNERFRFVVRAELTWNDTTSALDPDTAFDTEMMPTEKQQQQMRQQIPESTIFALARIKVDVDVPRPFSAIPKRAIEQTGDKAMQLSLKYLLRSFVKGLAADYQRWASDPEYRQQRAKLAKRDERICPLDLHLGS